MVYIEIIENKPARSTKNVDLSKDFKNLITCEYDDYICTNPKYKYDIDTNSIIINPDYEEQKAQEEAQRVALLNLTGADVERAIYKAKGMDFDDIIAFLEAQPLAQDGTAPVDIKALKIELKANNFYRGNPYIDTVGTLLGFTKEQLDEFFETNDYTKLITQTPSETPTEEPETQPTEEPETT